MEELSCDFCKAKVDKVRRVVLDIGYDRIVELPGQTKYACSTCSTKKDKERYNGRRRYSAKN